MSGAEEGRSAQEDSLGQNPAAAEEDAAVDVFVPVVLVVYVLAKYEGRVTTVTPTQHLLLYNPYMTSGDAAFFVACPLPKSSHIKGFRLGRRSSLKGTQYSILGKGVLACTPSLLLTISSIKAWQSKSKAKYFSA